jgi:predicted MFS family arabinose efflux permease
LNLAGIDPKNFKTILTICILFAFDAFGGAFIAKSFISFYYNERYSIVLGSVGVLLFFCNIVSGISGVLSSKLVQKIGVMPTMIFTHLPSNFFLLAIPFVNNSFIAMFLLFGRFCISQMNVPARQTYVNMAVSSNERSAANGLANIARSIGLSVGMGLNGYFISLNPESFGFTVPFLLAGGIKTVYDIGLWVCFLRGKREK